jgi:hypothetical protein
MLFLIDYDRRGGRIVEMRTFEKSAIKQAYDARLRVELDLYHKGIEREVVLFDAPDEAALRRTHGRYFKSAAELIQEMLDLLR